MISRAVGVSMTQLPGTSGYADGAVLSVVKVCTELLRAQPDQIEAAKNVVS